MTAFDYTVLLVIGLFALFGVMRGFVQELLALCGWAAGIMAVRYFHAPLSGILDRHLPSDAGSAVLAFFLLLLIPYAAVRIVAMKMGAATRTSMLAPVDRVLGLGFGAVKGILLVVAVTAAMFLVNDTIWGPAARPEWVTSGRTYPFVRAASEAMIRMLEDRHEALWKHDRAGQSAKP